MSNPKRNHPCPCGSGKKYKKCCMKKELEMEKTPHSLTASESEMLRRDQFVAMRQLQVQKDMVAKDVEYSESAIGRYNDFLDELAELPACASNAAVTGLVKKQIEVLEKQVEQSRFARSNEITLAALEVVLDVDD